METLTDYWFTIEPYVYINMNDKCALLYNTLDGVVLESDKSAVIFLLQEMLHGGSGGIVLLTAERYQQVDIKNFICDVRLRYMGDIIDVTLSEGKPIQIFPFMNYPHKRDRKCSFFSLDNLLQTLLEVSVHIDCTTNTSKLIAYLQSLPENLLFNIIGDWEDVPDRIRLFDFFSLHFSSKSIICSYDHVFFQKSGLNLDFLYRISVHLPIDQQKWEDSLQKLRQQELPFEHIFDVTSSEDCHEVDRIVEKYKLDNYRLNPIYTGSNIDFFKENIYLTKEDIISTRMSLKDFFRRRLINENDFGKIHIFPNGDIYANKNHSRLGNITTHSIYTIVRKEIEEGHSWLRIRNQSPCNTCVYQDLCPSPSDYEIMIGRPNLCHV